MNSYRRFRELLDPPDSPAGPDECRLPLWDLLEDPWECRRLLRAPVPGHVFLERHQVLEPDLTQDLTLTIHDAS